MSYEEYKQLSTLIITHMKREAERLEEEKADEVGLKKSQVVEWYLNEIEQTIDTEAELIEKKQLVEKVLDRLINHVSTDLSNQEKAIKILWRLKL